MNQTRGRRQQSNEIHFRNISTADTDELEVGSMKFDKQYLGFQRLMFTPKSDGLTRQRLIMHVQSPKWDGKYFINSPAWFDCLDLFINDLLIHSSPIYYSIFWRKTYNLFKFNMDAYSVALLRPSPAITIHFQYCFFLYRRCLIIELECM